MDCVCVPFRGWMGKIKDVSAFERGMVVGARRTGLSVSRTATLLVFFSLNSFPCVSRMVHYPTWHNCGKHWSLHGPASLWNAFDTLQSMPDELRLFWGQKWVQHNMRKELLMFSTFSVNGGAVSFFPHFPFAFFCEQICYALSKLKGSNTQHSI
jgi:hypothetical protein